MLEKVMRIYANVNGVEYAEVARDVLEGWISLEMLIEAYLEDEGIFNYAHSITALIEQYMEHVGDFV